MDAEVANCSASKHGPGQSVKFLAAREHIDDQPYALDLHAYTRVSELKSLRSQMETPDSFKGSLLIRFPVAAKMALHSAGIVDG